MLPKRIPVIRLTSGLLVGAATWIGAGPALGQSCSGQWLPGDSSLVGSVASVVTLPDGKVVAAGALTWAGGSPVKGIAAWNGVTWSALGVGMTDGGFVTSMTLLPNGDLVAGGWFSQIGTTTVNRVARWDGTSWHPMGFGVTNAVNALTTMANGDIVAGGLFGIQIWNGSFWSFPGIGVNNWVWSLLALPNGDLIVGGDFTTAGGVTANRIARWNGTSWSGFGSGIGPCCVGSKVMSLAVLPNGDLVAGGEFSTAGGASAAFIARWNGSSWSPMGTGLGGIVWTLKVLPGGELVAGGDFAGGIARWTGTAWSALGQGTSNRVSAMTFLHNGDLGVGGPFTTAGGFPSRGFARWTETNVPWIALHPEPQIVNAGGLVVFSSRPTNGYANLSAQWELETGPGSGVYGALVTGPIPGAAPANAAITQPNPSATPGPTTLTIQGVSAALHNRRVRAVVSNTCGSATSQPALLSVALACYADCNADTILNLADFGCFQTKFALQDPYADCNGDGNLNLADFGCFQTKFALGCP